MPKEKKSNREVRFGLWDIEKREEAEDDGYYHLSGKAVTFNDPTVLYPKSFTGLDYDINEVMDRGCFDNADYSDVVLNANHGDGNYAVARTRNKSLILTVKDDGVYIDAKLKKDNPRCAQFYKDVSEGLLDRMSFAFTIKRQAYDRDTKTYHVEEIGNVYDVSAVEFPADGNTSISASRSEDLVKLSDEAVALAKREEEKAKMLEDLNKLTIEEKKGD